MGRVRILGSIIQMQNALLQRFLDLFLYNILLFPLRLQQRTNSVSSVTAVEVIPITVPVATADGI